jgi:hypothetical protein
MKRMADPHAVKRIFRPLSDWTSRLECPSDGFAQRLSKLINGGVLCKAHQRVVALHRSSSGRRFNVKVDVTMGRTERRRRWSRLCELARKVFDDAI